MLSGAVLTLALTFGAACDDSGSREASAALRATTDEKLERLYREGKSFKDFLGAAKSRKEQWNKTYERAAVADDLLVRAKAAQEKGSFRLLVVAEDWCSDSVNSVPFLAFLAEHVPGLEMRIVNAKDGRPLMDAHHTPDGRAATPTVILLTSAFEEAGCWVERPAALQSWWAENKPKLSDGEMRTQKQAWYDRDGGRETVREIVEMMEAAAAGSKKCEG